MFRCLEGLMRDRIAIRVWTFVLIGHVALNSCVADPPPSLSLTAAAIYNSSVTLRDQRLRQTIRYLCFTTNALVGDGQIHVEEVREAMHHVDWLGGPCRPDGLR
jgi:hypothetical protein